MDEQSQLSENALLYSLLTMFILSRLDVARAGA
jgi:hypothetical protein